MRLEKRFGTVVYDYVPVQTPLDTWLHLIIHPSWWGEDWVSVVPGFARRPPSLDPGIDRLDPGKAFEQIKYTLLGLVQVLSPYNTLLHPSLRLPPEAHVGAPGLHLRPRGMK